MAFEGLTAIITTFKKLLPPWPIDGCLQVAHVSPMAAKVRKSCDYSSEILAVLGLALRDRAPNPP